MIINDSDAIKRLSSPMNLINRLKETSSRKSAMSLFGVGRSREVFIDGTTVSSAITGVEHLVENTSLKEKLIEEVTVKFNPFSTKEESQTSLLPLSTSPLLSETPLLETILGNSDSQIKLGLAHDRALELLNRSTNMLLEKLDDVSAAKLPSVISVASKTVESIRKERSEASKNNKDQSVHFHFYTPEQKKISDYEIIDVTQ